MRQELFHHANRPAQIDFDLSSDVFEASSFVVHIDLSHDACVVDQNVELGKSFGDIFVKSGDRFRIGNVASKGVKLWKDRFRTVELHVIAASDKNRVTKDRELFGKFVTNAAGTAGDQNRVAPEFHNSPLKHSDHLQIALHIDETPQAVDGCQARRGSCARQPPRYAWLERSSSNSGAGCAPIKDARLPSTSDTVDRTGRISPLVEFTWPPPDEQPDSRNSRVVPTRRRFSSRLRQVERRSRAAQLGRDWRCSVVQTRPSPRTPRRSGDCLVRWSYRRWRSACREKWVGSGGTCRRPSAAREGYR